MAALFQSCLGRCWWSDHSDYYRELRDLLKHVKQNAVEGDPNSVIKIIDQYTAHTRLKTELGKEKSYRLDEAVKRRNPIVALEIGNYCGYSTIRIASQMQMQESESVLYSIEMDAHNHAIATAMIEYAGFLPKVEAEAEAVMPRFDFTT